MKKWVIIKYTPYEKEELLEEYENPLDALAFLESKKGSLYSSYYVRENVPEYNYRDFKEAIEEGLIS